MSRCTEAEWCPGDQPMSTLQPDESAYDQQALVWLRKNRVRL